MDAVETLHQEGISVGVSPTISQLNLYEIVEFTTYFTNRKIPVWYCLYCYDQLTEDSLFTIGKKDNELEISDRETFVKVCDQLIEMKKQKPGIFITDKTLAVLKQLFVSGKRTWTCRALQNFLMVDHLGRVSGCHCQEPVASVSELLDVWESPLFEDYRRKYNHCGRCVYLCYVFYSIHSSVLGNIEIARDQFKNAKTIALGTSPPLHSFLNVDIA